MYIKSTFIILTLSLLIKLIFIYLTNFDLFGDEAQYWIWSQSLDFGYYSKPPFVAWIISFFTFFLGNAFIVILSSSTLILFYQKPTFIFLCLYWTVISFLFSLNFVILISQATTYESL